MKSELRFFGTSAAVPSIKRGFSCIGLIRGDALTLLDCGDGSIGKILSVGSNVLDIPRIFITHYHSDHLSGLTQVVETMGIRRRQNDLDVYGPHGLEEYFSTVEKITHVATTRRFKIKLHELGPGATIDVGDFSVRTFEMDHTVPCIGYRIETADFVLAYTGDTQPCNGAIDLAKNADFLIHEATYLKKNVDSARQTKHSTAEEAGNTAKEAAAKELIMTHVNDSYETAEEMLREVKAIHENSVVAHDGMEIKLD
jgi:ribonuclease Z